MTATNALPEVLSAPHVLEYPYRRSVGEVLSAFFTGLRDGKVLGIRGSDGRVLVPPQEYDPVTAETLTEMVPVGDAGVVTTWAWMDHPTAKNSLQKPFAWALVKLDGADTAMLHAVDAGSIDRMATGMRVKVRWRAERAGSIRDIQCFEPEASA
ncbi:MAG: OB-fold domain-containing protein [Candidatus Dormibacteraeota bacterium]|nr:OB-fold domain-containing protein [Candidatus Dormibacteraeota bacterium]